MCICTKLSVLFIFFIQVIEILAKDFILKLLKSCQDEGVEDMVVDAQKLYELSYNVEAL